MPPAKDNKPVVRLIAGKSVLGGDCLSTHEGKACFIEGAIPGETVDVHIVQEKKDFFRAEVAEVIEASCHRMKPVCPHVELCGGCQYQHVEYWEEARLKESQVRETIESVTGIRGCVEGILRSPRDYGYRRSGTFHLVDTRKKKALAYIGKDNKTPVILSQCNLLNPALQSVIDSGVSPNTDTEKVSFKLAKNDEIVSDLKESFYRVNLLGEELIVHSQCFFQNNWEVTEMIAERIRRRIKRLEPKKFFDLYAGVGTFTFLCAKSIHEIHCVEENPAAVFALKMNREEKKMRAVQVTAGRVEKVFRSLWKKESDDAALILMDPPRQGLEKELAEWLAAEVKAKALFYISCDPATLARDLKILLSQDRWKLESVTPFDMFPRTRHVEALAILHPLL